MNRFHVALAAGIALAGCSGDGTNPFFTPDTTTDTTDTTTTTDTTGITSDRTLPPGSTTVSPSSDVFRSEPTSTQAGQTGNGFAQSISYDATTDTFSVDNLGFDGDNVYSRSTPIGTLSGYAVYEADAQFTSAVTGTPINQLTHRAIYGIGTSTNTEFAIVRTGAYVEYGFGGFIYQRTGGVTLPTSGQALYSGLMAGLRDFNGSAGLSYTTSDIRIALDFDDFNATTTNTGGAVRGEISNRVVYDIAGNDITSTVLSRIENDNNITLNSFPTATFVIEPGALDENGEMLGTVQSFYVNSTGETEIFETGNYYAVVSGDNAEEIVGIVVLEHTIDPVASSVRETGGFVVYKQ